MIFLLLVVCVFGLGFFSGSVGLSLIHTKSEDLLLMSSSKCSTITPTKNTTYSKGNSFSTLTVISQKQHEELLADYLLDH